MASHVIDRASVFQTKASNTRLQLGLQGPKRQVATKSLGSAILAEHVAAKKVF
jgi:hypothetical protein